MRRIAAIVLPRLACELARASARVRGEELSGPFGVVVSDEAEADTLAPHEPLAVALLAAVDEQAGRYGVRPGQSVAEATAFVSRLRITRLRRDELRRELASVAELALAHGTTAALAIELATPSSESPWGGAAVVYPGGAGAGPEDTVWLDVSGCAHLVGGEDVLSDELRERVAELGHHACVAIADGPRIAQAVARWGRPPLVVAPGASALALAPLPIAALPLAPELRGWLGKLGILRVGELAGLERRKLSSRLGRGARELLELLAGRDEALLRAYEPAETIVERLDFEQELAGLEPLSFVLSGLVARATARLAARVAATRQLVVELGYDRAHARLAQLPEPQARLVIELPLPLGSADELLRAVRAKLEACELHAPVRSVVLELRALSPRVETQLALTRGKHADPGALPVLLAELSATLGPERVGVLRWADSHRPEAQSVLVPVATGPLEQAREAMDAGGPPRVTRLLAAPVTLGRLAAGQLVMLEQHPFVVDRVEFEARLDRVEWWTGTPVSRDYLRVGLQPKGARDPSHEHADAWAYLEPGSELAWLQGWFE